MERSVRGTILKAGVAAVAAAMLILPLPLLGGALLEDSPAVVKPPARTVKGLETGSFTRGKGWKATSTQESEVGSGIEQSMEYHGTFSLPESGTLDLLVERAEPEGRPVRWEALVSLQDNSIRDPYPFPLVVYLEWNSETVPGKSALFLDGFGPYREKLEAVWGSYVPIPFPVRPGDPVHIRMTWGPGGAGENRIYFNRTEAVQYLLPDGRTESPRGGRLSGILASPVGMKVGNSLQSPMSGTVLYRLALWGEILPASAPFAGGGDVAVSVTDDTFKIPGISGKLVAGDRVNVTLVASPGGKASFDLGNAKGIPMEEVPPRESAPGVEAVAPGTYRGTFAIRPGDDYENGQIVGNFVSADNVAADPALSASKWTVETKPRVTFQIDPKELPADSATKARIKIVAKDANGNPLKGRRLKLTLATTDQYTGTAGTGDFGKQVGGSVETRWKGETDSWGEVEFDYTAGFAAKTVLLTAKDLDSGGTAVDYITSFKDAAIDIAQKKVVSRAAVRRSILYLLKVEASRTELTADGRSRSVIRATLLDPNGTSVAGDPVAFSLSSPNGTVRTIHGVTDAGGVATAEYTAGTRVGIVVVTATATLRNAQGQVSIVLLADAPAKILLKARPDSLPADGVSRADIHVKVTDANDNPNRDTKVEFRVTRGGGKLNFADRVTDRNGDSSNVYTSGTEAGVATILATVRSLPPTEGELSRAGSVLFVPYLAGGDEIRIEKWLKRKGDPVLRGEPVVEYTVGRERSIRSLGSPYNATLGEILVEEWDRAEVGQTLAILVPR